MTPTAKIEKFGVLLRVGIFLLIALLSFVIFPSILHLILGTGGYLVTAALGTFAAGLTANAIPLRIYERGRLSDIGLGWNADSRRNLSYGLLGGIGAALCVLVLPFLARLAEFEPQPGTSIKWPSLAFLSVILLFGAVGEEMLFRGYAFQVLAYSVGPYATILPLGVLFGAAHMNNPGVTLLGVVNTALWGMILGFACIRSGDLWLPIGLHFGWNWTLPMLGVNMSGFTMNVTGYILHWKVGELWSGGDYGPEGGLLTTIVVFALLVFLIRAPIRTQTAFLSREGSYDS